MRKNKAAEICIPFSRNAGIEIKIIFYGKVKVEFD